MAKKVNKKEMLRQAKALRTVRGRVTKYIKNKTDSAFNDLADSVEANVETITIDFKTFKKNE